MIPALTIAACAIVAPAAHAVNKWDETPVSFSGMGVSETPAATLAEKPKKKGKLLKRILLLLVLSIAGVGGAHYGGFVDLTEYLPILEDYLP